MKKYLVQVTENINHSYIVDADSREEAEALYYKFNNEQLLKLDRDGSSDWDRPWDIEELGLDEA